MLPCSVALLFGGCKAEYVEFIVFSGREIAHKHTSGRHVFGVYAGLVYVVHYFIVQGTPHRNPYVRLRCGHIIEAWAILSHIGYGGGEVVVAVAAVHDVAAMPLCPTYCFGGAYPQAYRHGSFPHLSSLIPPRLARLHKRFVFICLFLREKRGACE